MSNPPANFPRLFPTPDETIAGIGRALREGRTTCEQILNGCLAQVDEWEPKVHAWVVLDRDRARDQARALDQELANGNDRGPLHGIPIGIKDIIDVAGLPTACGAKRWADSVAEMDAWVVANLRDAGAVIMGKTVTTPYAWIDPPITRNPWNLERTPGGSSSGSAAAVASGMCLGALGTQTGGSITRPASFCGVAGLKPGKLSLPFMTIGVKPFAKSLDHVGPMARTVDDLRILYCELSGARFKPRGEIWSRCKAPPRLGRLRGFFDRRAEPAVLSMLDDVVRALAASGAEIVDLHDPVDFETVLKDHRTIMSAEAAQVHSKWLDDFPDEYPPRIRQLVLEGQRFFGPHVLESQSRMQTVPHPRLPMAPDYTGAIDRMDPTAATIVDVFRNAKCAALLTPAILGTAPDPATTGDPAFNSPWSYTGQPTVSFAFGRAADGLPVAIQLVGSYRMGGEDSLLPVADWCEQAIRSSRQ